MIDLLIKHGANIDLPTPREVFCPYRAPGCMVSPWVSGTRALHCSVVGNHLGITRALLRAGANPNIADIQGFTPLAPSCCCTPSLAIAKELLGAGADPSQTTKSGRIALHAAARQGDTSLAGLLLSEAPSTVNHADLTGQTPLYSASCAGNERMVEYLLAAGATQPDSYDLTVCPLNVSVQNGHDAVVRKLLDIGLDAIGGLPVVLPEALCMATHSGRASILGVLLAVDGVEIQGQWANSRIKGIPLLHWASSYVQLSTVSILLAAGASENATNDAGELAKDVIGSEMTGKRIADSMRSSLIRMLQRGPAFRSHPWAWGVSAAATRDTSAVRAEELPNPLDVRVFRSTTTRRPLALLFAR